MAGDEGAGRAPDPGDAVLDGHVNPTLAPDDGALRGDVALREDAGGDEPLGQTGVEAARHGVLAEVAAVGVERPHLQAHAVGGHPVRLVGREQFHPPLGAPVIVPAADQVSGRIDVDQPADEVH